MLLIAGCLGGRLYQQGLEHIQKEQWRDAVTILEKASEHHPEDLRIQIALNRSRAELASEYAGFGMHLLESDRMTEAGSQFMAALELDRSNALARFGLESIQNKQKADQLKDQAQKLESNDQLSQALDQFREVLKILPDDRISATAVDRLTKQIFSEPAVTSPLIDQIVSFSFDQTDLGGIFQAIGAASGLNILTDDSIELLRPVSIQIKELKLRTALDHIARTYQLLIVPLADNSFLVTADNPENRQRFQKDEVRVFFLNNADSTNLKKLLDPLVSPAVVIADERSNAIVIRSDQTTMAMAEKLIGSMDSRDAEVLVNIELLEVSRGRLQELGVDLGSDPRVKVSIGSGIKASGTSGRLTLDDLGSLNQSNVFLTVPSLYLNLLKQDSHTRILAEPRLRILNRHAARFHVGEKVPLKVTTSVFRNTTEETSVYEYRDIGILIELTPRVVSGSELEMDLSLEISSILQASEAGLPTIGAREVKTVLRLTDGETEIIAGLIKDEERSSIRKIPLLGSIPGLGKLFSSLDQDDRQTDILVVITPVMLNSMRDESRMDTLWMGQAKETSKSRPSRAVVGGAAVTPAPGRPGTAGLPDSSPGSAGPQDSSLPGQTAESTPSQNEDQARVYFNPSSSEMALNQKSKISIMIENAANVGSVPFYIEFDPAVIQVTSVEEGAFLSGDGQATSFMSAIDNENGRVIIGLTRLGSPRGVSGSGVLMLMEISGKSLGTTTLRFTNQSVKDPTAQSLPSRFDDGSVMVVSG